MDTVMAISKTYDREVKDLGNFEHWYRLTRRDTLHHYGFTHETL